jgi:hypothetical protein
MKYLYNTYFGKDRPFLVIMPELALVIWGKCGKEETGRQKVFKRY